MINQEEKKYLYVTYDCIRNVLFNICILSEQLFPPWNHQEWQSLKVDKMINLSSGIHVHLILTKFRYYSALKEKVRIIFYRQYVSRYRSFILYHVHGR
jgi:hypothetical protein